MITEKVEAEVAVYFNTHPTAKKYDSPENRTAIADRLSVWGFTPCEVGVLRALTELVDEGIVERTDGRDEAMDRLAAKQAEQKRIDALRSVPSTTAEFERFARMSEAEVAALFYSDESFRARYEKACATWNFRLPPKPAPVADPSAEPDLGEWKNLDAKSYHSIPARQTTHLYMTNKLFKKAVDKLISQGAI